MKKIYTTLIICTFIIFFGYKFRSMAQGRIEPDAETVRMEAQLRPNVVAVKEFQDRTFDMYEIPQVPDLVNFDQDTIRWGNRVFYRNLEERANKHYVYTDITDFVKRNEYSPALLQNLTEQQIFEQATDYVTGYKTPVGVVGRVLEGSGKGIYPVALEDNATHTISLTTHRREDITGNFEGFYGGSKLGFLDRMIILLEADTPRKIRPILKNVIFDLSAARQVGLRADQLHRPNAPLGQK